MEGAHRPAALPLVHRLGDLCVRGELVAAKIPETMHKR